MFGLARTVTFTDSQHAGALGSRIAASNQEIDRTRPNNFTRKQAICEPDVCTNSRMRHDETIAGYVDLNAQYPGIGAGRR